MILVEIFFFLIDIMGFKMYDVLFMLINLNYQVNILTHFFLQIFYSKTKKFINHMGPLHNNVVIFNFP